LSSSSQAQRHFSFVLAMAMQAKMTAIERAFELAKSGRYMSVGQIKYRLHVEGYFDSPVRATESSYGHGAKNAMARRCG
jgi:hypothetical protein